MKLQKRIIFFTPILLAMIAALGTHFWGWSIYIQAGLLAAGLIVAAMTSRASRSAALVMMACVAAISLVALMEDWSGSRVFPAWLLGPMSFVLWQSMLRTNCTGCSQ
jgi:hypothetical protein